MTDVNLDYWARQLSDGDHPLIEEVRRLREENRRLVEAIKREIQTYDCTALASRLRAAIEGSK